MRAKRPGTDQLFEVTVYVNNIIATEYYLPNATSESTFIDTYIAVEPHDRLTFQTRLSGTVLHGHIDLVCDGTLAKQNRFEGNADGTVKYLNKRPAKFDLAFNCPKPKGWTSIESPKDVFEGEMIVNNLPEDYEEEVGGGKKPGVGNVEIVVSVNQHTLDNYHDPEASIEFGSWKERAERESVRLAEIPPEYAIELSLLTEDKIASKRSKFHRDKWQQTRFGVEAWGKFVFYYRSLSAIEQAGCVEREEGEVCELPPWDGEEEFVCADPVKKPVSRKKTVIKAESSNGDDVLFVGQNYTPEPEETRSSKSPQRQVSPKTKANKVVQQQDVPEPEPKSTQKKKKGKLGGALFAPPVDQEEDVPTPTIEGNGENDDEGSDVEPTDAELADAHPELDDEDDQPQMNEPVSNNSNKFSDYFDNQSSDGSDGRPQKKNTTLNAPSWGWNDQLNPAKSPRKEVFDLNDIFRSKANAAGNSKPPGSVQEANGANTAINPPHTSLSPPTFFDVPTMADSPTTNARLDRINMPAPTEIRNAMSNDSGTEDIVFGELFAANAPYGDNPAAQEEFQRRVKTIARQGKDGLWYKLDQDDAKKKKKVKKEDGGAAATSLLKEVNDDDEVAPPASRSTGKRKAPAAVPTKTPDKRARTKTESAATSVQPPPAAAFPKPPRTESATPSIAGGAGSRKKKIAQLKREIREKQAKAKAMEESREARARREEEEIAELERLNAEADERLRQQAEMETGSSEGGDEGEGEDDGEED